MKFQEVFDALKPFLRDTESVCIGASVWFNEHRNYEPQLSYSLSIVDSKSVRAAACGESLHLCLDNILDELGGIAPDTVEDVETALAEVASGL